MSTSSVLPLARSKSGPATTRQGRARPEALAKDAKDQLMAADVGESYSRPTPAMEAVFDSLNRQAKEGQEKLEKAISGGNALF